MANSIKARSRRRLLLAATLGLVAALSTYVYVETRTREHQMSEAALVVVARVDVPAKTKLTHEALAMQEMPLEAIHPAALTAISEAEGRMVAVPLTKGEQVLTTKFQAQKEEKLSLAQLIPPGMRAVAVTYSEIIGTSGLIVPGDHVDVIAVFDAKTMGKDQAIIILQDVLVLSVAQAIAGEEEMPVASSAAAQETANASLQPSSGSQSVQRATGVGQRPTQQTPGVDAEKAIARPQAKSATLALTPEQVQRLALAESTGKLRLALRPPKDAAVVDLPEATLSKIKEPIEAASAIITSAEIWPTNVKPGDIVSVRVTVKNTSNIPLRSQGPDPKFTYVQGQTFHSQDYPSEDGAYRVGVNFAGQSSAPFPYRWGMGGDLAPGASTTVEGQIKIAYDFEPTNFWVGLIKEPGEVVQDAVATTLVTAFPANVAVVAVDAANVRSGPSISSAIVTQFPYGKELEIIGSQNDWYKVRLEDGREGWVAAGWIVTASER